MDVVFSSDFQKVIDEEIRSIINTNHELARKILNDNIDTLHSISEALILWETLDAKQIDELIAGKDIGVPVISDSDDDSGAAKPSETAEVKKDDPKPSGSGTPQLA